MSVREFYLFIYFYVLLFFIHGVSTVGIRRAKNESSFTQRGLRTREYQKHEISPRIQVRSLENPKFRYFLISTVF